MNEDTCNVHDHDSAQRHADIIEAGALAWALDKVDADERTRVEARINTLRARTPE